MQHDNFRNLNRLLFTQGKHLESRAKTPSDIVFQ